MNGQRSLDVIQEQCGGEDVGSKMKMTSDVGKGGDCGSIGCIKGRCRRDRAGMRKESPKSLYIPTLHTNVILSFISKADTSSLYVSCALVTQCLPLV